MTEAVPNYIERIEAMSHAELLERRRELVEKGNGKPSEMEDTDLEELVAIFTQLRRRSSGPPKDRRKNVPKPVSDDVLFDIL